MKTFWLHFTITFIITYVFTHQEPPPIPYNAISSALVFVAVFTSLWITTFIYNKTYFYKLPKAVVFGGYFMKELVVANMKIAFDIVTPHYYMRPTIIALPLAATTDLEITLLACMITLTPGTLSIDVSDDRKTLYVHAMYVKKGDVEKLKEHIKHGFERRLLELTT